MSENPKLYPSPKKYEGPKYDLTEDLNTLTTRIDALDESGVAKWLEKYIWIIPGKKDGSKNTFEMMALYQKAMKLLPGNQFPDVDARFWPETHKALKIVQKDILNFEKKFCDGLPWPETTEALIIALQSKSAVAAPAAPAAPASAPPAVTPAQKSAPAPATTPAPAVNVTPAPAAAPAPAKPAVSVPVTPPAAPATAPAPAPATKQDAKSA
jgi:hypothetical protein